jgi:hypothetical protein
VRPRGALVGALLLVLFAAPLPRAQPVWEVRRGPAVPEAARWFAERDRLLDSLDALFWELRDGSLAPDAVRARGAADALLSAAREYSKLAGDDEALKAADASAKRLLSLVESPGRLNAEARAALYGLKGSSVHRFARLMLQRALELPGPKGAVPANLLATVRLGSMSVELPALDVEGLSPEDAVRALRPLMPSFLRWKPAGGAVVLSRERCWLRVPGGELYLHRAAAAAGGTVRVIFREEDGSPDAQASFYLLSRALLDAGFAVSVENGDLLAVIDGTRSRLGAGELEERFAFAARALAESRALGPRLGAWLRGTTTKEENAVRLDALSRILVAEGGFGAFPEWADTAVGTAPASGLEFDGPDFPRAVARYRAREGDRRSLRERLGRTLSVLGLPSFPEEPVGRRTLSLHYDGPIEAALARGELRLENGRPVRVAGYDLLSRLAREGRPLSAAAAARLQPLAGGLRFVGRTDGRAVLSGQPGLDEDRAVLVALGLGAGGRVERGLFELVARGAKRQSLDAEKALALLSAAGELRPAPKSPLPPAEAAALTSSRGASLDATLLHPGPAVEAELTFSRGRALEGGRIYAAPYASGADESALFRAKALLVTHGGTQSALLAAAAGLPALELHRAEWSGAGLSVEVGGRTVLLREGARVRVDPAAGVVLFVEPAAALVPEKLKTLPRIESLAR